MALIKCSECGKVFSDKALACPNCACPTELIDREMLVTNIQESTEISKCEDTKAVDKDLTAAEEEKQENSQVLPHKTENLMSFDELKQFAFHSVLPHINKELGESITNVNKGRGNGDVDFFLTCNERVIGIRVKIDAYPDIMNAGRFFGETKTDVDYAKAMYEEGYEFAVANIGVGSSDPIRFARRIFLQKDGYYFNYKQLQFIDYGKFKDIRFSLSREPEDESWKDLAGIEYLPPKKENVNSMYLIEKPEDENVKKIRELEDKNWDIWRDTDTYKNLIHKYYQKNNIRIEDMEFHCELFEYMARMINYRGSVDTILNYFYNAIDFVNGMFLKDSPRIAKEDVLSNLKEISADSDLVKLHDIDKWTMTAYNYLVLKYCFNKTFVEECLAARRRITDKKERTFGFLIDVIQREFRENPVAFGYPQSLKDRIKGLLEMNSPEYFPMFEAKKDEIRKGMVQFTIKHNRVVDRKQIYELRDYDIKELERYEQETYAVDEFINKHFDDKMDHPMRITIQSFINEMKLYRTSMQYDCQMIRKALERKVGFFEHLEDAKESKRKYDMYFASKSSSK